jgi:CubicO group peptidase (beta-lactamase class C family)
MKQFMIPAPIKRTFLMTIVLIGCLGFPLASAQAQDAQAEAIVELAREAMTKYDLKAVIVRVTINGKEIVTKALASPMTGVPATEDMHFRNGAVAISYISTLLLQLVDQKLVSLDDKLSNWLPELPDAEAGHAADAGQHDGGLSRPCSQPAVHHGVLRQSVPAVDASGAD